MQNQFLLVDSIPTHEDHYKLMLFILCKNPLYMYCNKEEETPASTIESAKKTTETSRPKLLSAKGTIVYDLYYRSHIDTPYAENNIYQHTLQTNLQFVYKEAYPVRVVFTIRQSNSNFFRKYIDIGFNFNPADFKNIIRSRIERYALHRISEYDRLIDSLKSLLELKQLQFDRDFKGNTLEFDTQNKVEARETVAARDNPDPNNLGMMEAGEKTDEFLNFRISEFADSIPDFKRIVRKNGITSSVNVDTSVSRTSITRLIQKADSAQDLIRNIKDNIKILADAKISAEQLLRENFKNLKGDRNSLGKFLGNQQIPDSILPKGYKFLTGLKKIGLGRTMADYSDLTVRNLTISGLQLEYQQNNYLAFAAGKITYRYREYIVPELGNDKQFVSLARIGKGTREGNHLFFTYYLGRRIYFNHQLAIDSGKTVDGSLSGISIEWKHRIGSNFSVTGEIAKSSIPVQAVPAGAKTKWFGVSGITDFSTRSNEAYAIRVNGQLPKATAKLNGGLRYTGRLFQSFSMWNTGSKQLNWDLKWTQTLGKGKFDYSTSFSQIDQSTEFVAAAYRTSAVLASFQASAHLKRNLHLTGGFFPSFQLVKSPDQSYEEVRYYTIHSTATKFFRTKRFQHLTAVSFSQFFNDPEDSSLIYYNAKNVMASHQVVAEKFSVSAQYTLSMVDAVKLSTIETNTSLQVRKWVRFGCGLKLISNPVKEQNLFGYGLNAGFIVPHLGEISLVADKGFLPDRNQALVANHIGRLTYTKIF